MYVKKLITIVTILFTSLACNLVQSAVQDEVMQSEQIETMESETTSVPTNESTSESEAISTKSTGLEFVEVPTDGTVVAFKMTTTEVSNEQYVQFLNEAIVAGFITYNSVDHKVYDQDGNEMIWLAGSRVVKDHDKDGVYVVEEMEWLIPSMIGMS
jgi:formylglycine-generating enzyme required for sulfatase activity